MRSSFIVYTSNVFEILGLRSLYFALAGMMDLFHYLKYGLSAILMFVGGKMLAHAITVESTIMEVACNAITYNRDGAVEDSDSLVAVDYRCDSGCHHRRVITTGHANAPTSSGRSSPG